MSKLRISLFNITAVLFIVALSVYSCKKEVNEQDNNNPNTENDLGGENQNQEHGIITGTIYAENGTSKIPAVKVFVDIDGEIYLTKTDKNGKFSLSVPEGDHILHIHSGNGKLFFSSAEVSVSANQTYNLPQNQSILNQQGNFAYIGMSGGLDNIQTIVIDSLGYQADELVISDFLSLNTLQQYDIIFINCGVGPLEQQIYDNVEQYLIGGGDLFISDLSVSFLKGDDNILIGSSGHGEIVDALPKTCTSLQGGFVSDNDLCTKRFGGMDFVSANVLDSDLEIALGLNQFTIYYEIGAWETIQVLSNAFDVLLEDAGTSSKDYGPLVIRSNAFAPWAQGNGTTSQSGDFVTICHTPPGNPSNSQTLTISANAVQAHLDHGCSIGACEGNGGRVLFTTFHNHPGATNSTTAEKVTALQYFILSF